MHPFVYHFVYQRSHSHLVFFCCGLKPVLHFFAYANVHNRLSFHVTSFLRVLYSRTAKKKQGKTCTRVFFMVARKQTITREFFMSLELVNNWKTFFGVDTDEMLCSTLNISMSALQKWKHSRGEPSPAMLRNIEFRKQIHEQKTRKKKDKKNV